ncbi:MAG: efflux transporter outer membrane subunit, partial [Planctomycetes bacterium]|nr:efflux transporter outer membrane subunit [Planctomycetota bacterium]
MKQVSFLCLFALAGCVTVGPDYQAPELELAAEHRADLENLPGLFGAEEGDAIALSQWWTAFQDPVLTGLVERTVVENFDLRQAIARVVEAEARLGVDRAAAGPRAGVNGSYTRSGISENTQFGLFPGQDRESDSHRVTLDASWEIDLWGKARRSIEAAEAELAAGVEGIWAVRVSLAGQVADAYLRLRELELRMQIAQGTVEVLLRGVETAQARFDAGLVQELDLLRARTDLESARAILPELEQAKQSVLTELCLLTSVEPGQLDALLAEPGDGPVLVPTPDGRLGQHVPMDLLRRRPDVRVAERQLAAQTARVGMATAELYPSFSLTGSIGFQAERSDNLFKEGSFIHNYGPSFSLPLFSGGGLRANIKGEDARVDQALLNYEKLVLTALHEVDSAATGISLGARRLEALESAVAQAKLTLDRSGILYREGLANIDAVLDSRRALFQL